MEENNEILNKIIDDIITNISLEERLETRHNRDGDLIEYPLYYDKLKHEWNPIKDWVIKNAIVLALTEKINERIELAKQK